MTNYDGPKRANKIKDGKLGVLVDSQNRKPFEYKDTGKRYPLQIVQFKRDILKISHKPMKIEENFLQNFIV